MTRPAAQAFMDAQLLLDAGLEQPGSIRLAQALRAKGWPVDREAVSLEQLAVKSAGLISGDGEKHDE